MNIDQATEVLQMASHRITRTRKQLLQAIFKMRGPFSAGDLLASSASRSSRQPFDLVTIYRNLPLFEEVGIICRSDFSNGTSHFVLASGAHAHHHHHIVCRDCHKVEALDFCIVDAQEKILNQMGFSNIEHRLEFTGTCRACG